MWIPERAFGRSCFGLNKTLQKDPRPSFIEIISTAVTQVRQKNVIFTFHVPVAFTKQVFILVLRLLLSTEWKYDLVINQSMASHY